MSSIILKDISFSFGYSAPLFQNISFTVPRHTVASLIGPNGCGKSTLIDIISGRIEPRSGETAVNGTVWVVPQHTGQFDDWTAARVLGIEPKLDALRRITSGSVNEADYTALDEDWEIESRAEQALSQWGFPQFDLSRPVGTLSGGEKTRLLLAGITIHDPEIVIMDEPTNHLDAGYRERLYTFIEGTNKTVLLTSHDRTLLDLVDLTFVLGKDGIKSYGGGYSLYKEARDLEERAAVAEIEENRKQLRAARRIAREALERKDRADSRGEKKSIKAGDPRIMMRLKKNRAQKSANDLRSTHEEKIEHLTDALRDSRAKRDDQQGLKIDLPDSAIHSGKILARLNEVNMDYGGGNLWENDLSFVLDSGRRIALRGDNGSGKSTFVKFLTGELTPTKGIVESNGFSSLYLDQDYSSMGQDMTALEFIDRRNGNNMPDHLVKTELARFGFGPDMWDRECRALSGGEKMKLIFCSMVVSGISPDVLILDEPTNNLDIASLETVTETLKEFKGTMIVISHDRVFLEEMNIETAIWFSGKGIVIK